MTPATVQILVGIAIACAVGLVGFLVNKAQKGIVSDATTHISDDIIKMHGDLALLNLKYAHLEKQVDELKREFRDFRGGPMQITRLPDGHRQE